MFQSTPLREGRLDTDYFDYIDVLFQSTPLREGRLDTDYFDYIDVLFQSTPLREGRRKQYEPFEQPISFNPRPCVRGDSALAPTSRAYLVSIHAPA